MAIQVDIADRQYDYTDEEKAAEVVAEYQSMYGLDDAEVIAVWGNESDPRRAELERLIFTAVDENGSAKRAQENIPDGISFVIAETV